MIFGNPKEFAIEAYHEPSGPKWGGFGRMCIHMDGITIGDIEEHHCSMHGAARVLRWRSKAGTSFWDNRFDNLSDQRIFDFLDAKLYQNTGQSLDQMHADWNEFGRYNFLTNAGEQFDESKTFFVCRPNGRIHVLYYKHPPDVSGSASCSFGAFRGAAESFLIWYDECVRTPGPPYFKIPS